MNFLRRLFGRKPASTRLTTPAPAPPPPPAGEPIRVYDKFGREAAIDRETWRTQVLPHNLRKAWDHPEELSALVIMALKDGFTADVADAAVRLHRIDPDRVRASCVRGSVLFSLDRFDESEAVLRDHIARHGEHALILVNLAKIQSQRGEHDRSRETLGRALRLDPNLSQALEWYAAIALEHGGEPAAYRAYTEAAGIAGSWRAQLHLARAALESNEPRHAGVLYDQALAAAGPNPPSDLLQQMSGDLGIHGQLRELVSRIAPIFDPTKHGLGVANNLILALTALGEFDEARSVLDSLYALKRPDWASPLNDLENSIARARLENQQPEQQPPRMFNVAFLGPVWLPPTSPAAALLAPKAASAPGVCFHAASLTPPGAAPPPPHVQLSTGPGRMTRALPLFLAERVHFALNTRVVSLFPWAEPGGFVVAAAAWSDEHLAALAAQADPPCTFLAAAHIRADRDPWRAVVRLLRARDRMCLTEIVVDIPPSEPGIHLGRASEQLIDALRDAGALPAESPPAWSLPPTGAALTHHLLHLEQLLAVRCDAGRQDHPSTLVGSRDILRGMISACLGAPAAIAPRTILAHTCMLLHDSEPAATAELRDPLRELARAHPLPEPFGPVLNRMIEGAAK